MGQMRNSYKILAKNMNRKDLLGEVGTDRNG
jgi:hypothetical protein